MEPGRGSRCPHGHPAPLIPAEEYGEGWVVPVASAECGACETGVRIGIPFKPGEPPGTRKRSVEEVAAAIDATPTFKRRERPLSSLGTCMECGGTFGPSTVKVECAGGGFRHATGSPACRVGHGAAAPVHVEQPPSPPEKPEPEERPVAPPDEPEPPEAPEEPCACPTCGRPVVDGAPYDLNEIRVSLQRALQAVDDLLAGESREREALEEMDEPT